MRALVVGLVNRPQRKPLSRALARRGHTLEVCYSTDLVIEASPERFNLRLRDRPLDAFDAIILWSVKHRRWEWYLACEELERQQGTVVLSRRFLDPHQPPSISTGWDLMRLTEAGIPVARTLMFADEGAAPRLLRELSLPVVVRGMRADHPSSGKVAEDGPALDALLADRGERAFILSELVPARLAFRFLTMGYEVASALKLPTRGAYGLAAVDDSRPLPLFAIRDELAAVAVRAARAVGADVAEIDVALSAATGEPVVLTVSRSLERCAFDDYGDPAWDALVRLLEAQLMASPRAGAAAATADTDAGALASTDSAHRLDEGSRTEGGDDGADLQPLPRPTLVKSGLRAGEGPPRLTVCVLQLDPSADAAPALRAARILGERVVLASPDAPEDADADVLVPISADATPQGGWDAALGAVEGEAFAWLRAEDRMSAADARALRAAFDALDPEWDGLAVPYSLLRDGNGYDRHRPTTTRILRLSAARALDATGLVPRAPSGLNILWYKDLTIRWSVTEAAYAAALEAACDRLEVAAAPADALELRAELGEGLVRSRRYAEGLEILASVADKAPGGAPRARILTLMALAHLRLGDRERCRLFARSALSEDPALLEPRHLLGESYYEAEAYKEARRWLEEAHGIPLPDDRDALYPYWYQWFSTDTLSVACDRLGDWEAALAYLGEVEAALPSSGRIQRNRQRLEAARARAVLTLEGEADGPLPEPGDGRRLSACIIVRDGGSGFADCLSTLHLVADEIVIVDTGSADDTLAIARQHTPHVYTVPWEDDFSAARNVSLDKATGSHLLWLDADDRLSPEDARRLRRHFLALPGDVEVVRIPYVYSTDEAGGPRFIQDRERILLNHKDLRFIYPIHEYVPTEGRRSVTLADVTLHHAGGDAPGTAKIERNLRILNKALIDPRWQGDRHMRFHLAQALTSLDRHAEARPLYEALLATSENDHQRGRMGYRLARSCYAQRDIPNALRYAELSRMALPGLREPLLLLGEIAMDAEDLRGARLWYERALRIPRGRWAIHQHWYRWEVERRLAEVYIALERWDDAARMVDILQERLPGSEITARLRAQLSRRGPPSAPTPAQGSADLP